MSDKNAPRNTQRETLDDPFLFFAEALMAGSPGPAITSQEKRGQQEFVNSDVLPTDIYLEDRAALETAGFKFGEILEDDALFRYVEMPEGWVKRPTSHDMWSDLLDDKGRKRASIFYKAAFYDRRAFLRCEARFSTRLDYKKMDAENIAVAYVRDSDNSENVYQTEPIAVESDHGNEEEQQALTAAADWLDSNYPGWKSPSAHWD